MANMKLLRIYTDEAAYFGDERVFEVVAARVQVANLAGVTVVRALFGFGHSPHRHRHLLLEEDQPLVIEIIDEGGTPACFRSIARRHLGHRADDARSRRNSVRGAAIRRTPKPTAELTRPE
ncbi:DUF190 domain-containing protein [Novosphingobium capsulatum]|uniref:DUF190 domain-containing protein n=1 Tax=Novosphingobium capsulatum TaxID=13688 RepID=UPI002E0FF780|nr:DUF190 domain-containing protein [Novosphingobium capsulatum]